MRTPVVLVPVQSTPPDPMDEVEFLARSDHRVTVLRTLSDRPRTRADLHDATGIPQPTLGRILGDFTERNWAERDGHEYALTEPGMLVAAAFDFQLLAVGTARFDPVLAATPSFVYGVALALAGLAVAAASVFHPRRLDSTTSGLRSRRCGGWRSS